MIVFAHEPASNSGALKDVAVDTLGARAQHRHLRPLCGSFQAVGGPVDFTHAITEPFDYLAEQRVTTHIWWRRKHRIRDLEALWPNNFRRMVRDVIQANKGAAKRATTLITQYTYYEPREKAWKLRV